jgi:hypothetical protein
MHHLGVEGVHLLTPVKNTSLKLVFLTGANHMLPLTGLFNGRPGHNFATYFITISTDDDL